MRRPVYPVKSLLAGSIALMLPLVMAGCGKPAGGPQMGDMAMPVQTETISAMPVEESSEFLANLISRQSVTLHSEVMGQVTSIYVRPGQQVGAGQLLMQVDPRRQQASVQVAGAAAQATQATIQQARENLQTIAAQQAAAQSALELSQREYNRYAALHQQQIASRQELERATDALNQARANLQANQAQQQVQQAAIATAQSNYRQAVANVRQQQVQLRYFKITAPFAGTVGDIPVKVGTYVTQLSDLTSVTQNNPLEVNVSVPADQARRVNVGTAMDVVATNGDILGRSRVRFVSPRVDPETQTVLVKAYLDNPGGRLKADQLVKARVVWQSQSGITVPMAAVSHMGGQDFVFRVNQKGKQYLAQQVPVTLGGIHRQRYVVKQGLQPGETIVTAGVQKLRDGAPVTLMNDSPRK